MVALLTWPLVTLMLGLLLLALLWDFLRAWLRGIRSERQVLAVSMDELRLRLITLEKAWPLLAEHHETLVGHVGELSEKLKKMDARIIDPAELRNRR